MHHFNHEKGAPKMSSFKLNRRSILQSAAASAAAVPFLGGNRANASVATSPLRAVHRFQLGSMRITVIDDARFTFPAGAFAANQPKDAIGKFLGGFGLPTDTVSLHMQTTLV